jgi:basic membrane protein A
LKAGEWNGGETVVYNLSNEGVGIAPTSSKHVPADVLAEVDQLTARIKKGEFKVPSTKAEYDAFKF